MGHRSEKEHAAIRARFCQHIITSQHVDPRKIGLSSVLPWVQKRISTFPTDAQEYLEELTTVFLDSDSKSLYAADLYDALGLVGDAGFEFVVDFWKHLLDVQRAAEKVSAGEENIGTRNACNNSRLQVDGTNKSSNCGNTVLEMRADLETAVVASSTVLSDLGPVKSDFATSNDVPGTKQSGAITSKPRIDRDCFPSTSESAACAELVPVVRRKPRFTRIIDGAGNAIAANDVVNTPEARTLPVRPEHENVIRLVGKRSRYLDHTADDPIVQDSSVGLSKSKMVSKSRVQVDAEPYQDYLPEERRVRAIPARKMHAVQDRAEPDKPRRKLRECDTTRYYHRRNDRDHSDSTDEGPDRVADSRSYRGEESNRYAHSYERDLNHARSREDPGEVRRWKPRHVRDSDRDGVRGTRRTEGSRYGERRLERESHRNNCDAYYRHRWQRTHDRNARTLYRNEEDLDPELSDPYVQSRHYQLEHAASRRLRISSQSELIPSQTDRPSGREVDGGETALFASKPKTSSNDADRIGSSPKLDCALPGTKAFLGSISDVISKTTVGDSAVSSPQGENLEKHVHVVDGNDRLKAMKKILLLKLKVQRSMRKRTSSETA